MSAYPHAVAFSIQRARNLAVQGLGMGMVSIVCLSVMPWQAALAWSLVAVGVVMAENQMLRAVARHGPTSIAARVWAPMLRVAVTSTYALAAFVMIDNGGPAERFFAFALISASVVHVLMRYYRSPAILAASLAPYIAVTGAVGFHLARVSIEEGHELAALTAVFTITMFSVQFWSARAQLCGAWNELMAAREAAEQRERAAETANKAKSQFLATMSHELRTPLNGVLGMAQTLMADPLTPAQHERVKVIRRSSESLLAVLNDLLDLSKIETGGLEIEVGEFDMEHLVRGVAAAFQPLAEKKSLGFEFEVADGARGRCRGDSARIRRVLYSLCDNAVKFTDKGGVTLRVRRERDRVAFRIADTGIGIEDKDLARLFEGFFQADAGHSRRYGGVGVGLAICHELTTLMGGEIEAFSRPGEGSSFIVTLPLERVDVPVETLLEPEAVAEGPPPGELRVLAAEDNATNQLVLKAFLAPAGIAPTLVINGRDALAAWEDQTWDIVLMDIQMPVMDGIEAARAIRRREQETGRPRTPIVAVTANAMSHQILEYEAAGMDGVVSKPVDMATLFDVMEQALARADVVGASAQQGGAA